jgi:4-hydroxy-3-polyprenylbenzoate decarboxylase
VIGISGASGVVYGLRLLELLKPTVIETHLIMSRTAEQTLAYETDRKLKAVKALADQVHNADDLAARFPAARSRPWAWWWRPAR